jgi:glycosyltransferase involved in cell wall biosynthesis
MRIGIDASRANLAQRTGTEWYAFHLTRAFFNYLRPTDEVFLYVKEPLRSEWGSLPVNVHVRILRWPPRLLWTQLRLSWEMLMHRIDVLFVPAHTIPFLSPKRTITTLHDIGFMHAASLYGAASLVPKGKRFLNAAVQLFTLGKYHATELDYHRFSAKLALKKCQTILTVSEYSKNDICETFHVDPARVHVVPNAYDRALFNPSVRQNQSAIAKALQLAGVRQPYLMTIGRIEKKKNTLGLVQAFARLKESADFRNYQLLLVGSPGFGADDVRDACTALGVGNDVIQPGWLPEEQIPALMAGAEAFILPSLFEGFGIPVLEAMAVGTPVVCSNTTSLPEVSGGAAVLVSPKNVQEIADAIQRICTNPTYAEELRQRGYRRADNFSWEASAKQLAGILLQ